MDFDTLLVWRWFGGYRGTFTNTRIAGPSSPVVSAPTANLDALLAWSQEQVELGIVRPTPTFTVKCDGVPINRFLWARTTQVARLSWEEI
ncbi:hypothetical protein BIU98_00610 [Curtobacterium sp. MMLR14_010]|nr:hypothetical protein BIU98_00610 [Curtobacterium sp. MMLR14_010]